MEGSITNIGGGSGLEMGDDDDPIPGEADAKGYGSSVWED